MSGQSISLSDVEQALEVRQVDFSWLLQNCKKVDDLALVQEEPTPFSTAAWLKSWWAIFSSGYELILLIVIDDEELYGFFPLVKHRVANTFIVLEWLATGRSDHAPLLIKKEYSYKVLPLVGEYIKKQLAPWHVISLRTLQPSQRKALEEFFELGNPHIVKDDVSPTLGLMGTWDEYLKGKSKRHRGNIRRMIRNAEEIVDLTVDCIHHIDDKLLDEVADVERNSWKGVDGSLRISGKGYKFFQAALEELSEHDVLELWICRYKGKLLSYIITFQFANRIYFYNGAYINDYKLQNMPKRISPGSLLIALALKSAYERSLISFDFLRGDEGYKGGWASDRRDLYQFVLPNSGIKGFSAYVLLYRFRWWIRQYPFAQKVWRSIKSI